jgi:Ca2+-transporting ATPase
MPRDTSAPAAAQTWVAALPGSAPMMYHVRGLRGSSALADWIEGALGRDRVRASSATGLVRLVDKSEDDGAVWTGRLTEAVRGFDPVPRARTMPRAAPRRPRPATQSTARRTDRQATIFKSDAHAVALDALLQRLQATNAGLTKEEAGARLARDGRNEIADVPGRSDREILLDQFKSVPVALLAASGAVSLATRAFADAGAIGVVLAANGGLGFWTERKAEQTVSSLRKLAPGSALVVRDRLQLEIPTAEVVVGDLLVLKPGTPIAADARVIEAHRLSTNESALTGESLPVRKAPANGLAADIALGERRNMVHMGTVVSGGDGLAVVCATGHRTALGAIRALVEESSASDTRLQQELGGLGKRLALGATALCAGVFGVGLLRGRAVLPMLRTAVSLGVAAIPEGLPTVATSLLASSIRTLQQRKVYARRLDAIENLGAVDVVCFDKTGTLTQNRMTVAEIAIGRRHGAADDRSAPPVPADLLKVAALCCDIEPSPDGGWTGSSTEVALAAFAAQHGTDVAKLRRSLRRIGEKQRSEHHPYMVTLHAAERGHAFVAVKGRPQEVLHRCTAWFDGRRVISLNAQQRRALLTLNDGVAERGHRVLALACRKQQRRSLGETGGLTWLGMVGLSDPLRPGIDRTIARFKAASIRPLMLTGDQLGTATAIAHQAGLNSSENIVDAAAFPEDAAKLQDAVAGAAGFARTSPAMKLQIVKALQARGHVVAMTGDGINDGPALKMSDVGVAMGVSGTDFAHSMSDLVLQNDHPDGLLDAIAEGRTGYLNVKKAVEYLVSTNVSELLVMAIAVAAGLDDPLDPMALLWTNLITDVSPAIALGLEPPEPDILQRPPFPRRHALLEGRDWAKVAVDGGMITAATLVAYLYGLGRYGPGPRAKTMAFMTMTSAQLLHALTARSEAPLKLFGRSHLRSNPWLTRTVLLSLAAQAATLFPPLRGLLRTAPLSLIDLGVVLAAGTTPALAREAMKRLRGRPPATDEDSA